MGTCRNSLGMEVERGARQGRHILETGLKARPEGRQCLVGWSSVYWRIRCVQPWEGNKGPWVMFPAHPPR
jgi:hypothetical protein